MCIILLSHSHFGPLISVLLRSKILAQIECMLHVTFNFVMMMNKLLQNYQRKYHHKRQKASPHLHTYVREQELAKNHQNLNKLFS